MPRGIKDDDENLDELSKALRLARKAAGLKQPDVVTAAIGLTQNKISRIENGAGHVLTDTQLGSLLTLYRVSKEERQRITMLVQEARNENVDARVILQKGAHHYQERLRVLTKESRLVRSFVPNAAIGYLQTEAYARVVMNQRMDPVKAELSLKKRMEQHRLTLDQSGREWVFVLTEGALRWNVGGPVVMVAQAEAIAAAVDNPSIKLGVIPWYRAVDLVPLHSFHIYDRRAVVVGTWSGTTVIRDKAGVKEYEALFDRVLAFAVFGDEARSELRRIADEYRRL